MRRVSVEHGGGMRGRATGGERRKTPRHVRIAIVRGRAASLHGSRNVRARRQTGNNPSLFNHNQRQRSGHEQHRLRVDTASPCRGQQDAAATPRVDRQLPLLTSIGPDVPSPVRQYATCRPLVLEGVCRLKSAQIAPSMECRRGVGVSEALAVMEVSDHGPGALRLEVAAQSSRKMPSEWAARLPAHRLGCKLLRAFAA
jgi:hypothetical protein